MWASCITCSYSKSGKETSYKLRPGFVQSRIPHVTGVLEYWPYNSWVHINYVMWRALFKGIRSRTWHFLASIWLCQVRVSLLPSILPWQKCTLYLTSIQQTKWCCELLAAVLSVNASIRFTPYFIQYKYY